MTISASLEQRSARNRAEDATILQDEDVFIGLGPATYKADGGAVTHNFTAQVLAQSGSNRLAKRDRPFRQGAKLDFVGTNADAIVVDCIWHADVAETDLVEGEARWPDALERFIEDLKTGTTGTLNLPWKRGIRCKGDNWSRVASGGEHRGGETLRVTFTEDNEDSLDRQATQLVSVKAKLQGQVASAQFDMESEGMDLGSIEDITGLAADVVGLLNAPGDMAAALLHAGNRLRLAAKTVATAFSTGAPGHDQMNDAQASNARLQLLALSELGARAVGESRPRKTRTITYNRLREIWSIANEVGQSARDLMTMNEQIEDFGAIPPGTPVRVFA